MDPLPFLFVAVNVFWLAQIIAWGLWQYKKPQPPATGTGDVKASEFIITHKKVNRKKKK